MLNPNTVIEITEQDRQLAHLFAEFLATDPHEDDVDCMAHDIAQYRMEMCANKDKEISDLLEIIKAKDQALKLCDIGLNPDGRDLTDDEWATINLGMNLVPLKP